MKTKEITISDVFNQDGLLAGEMQRYEYRANQVEMSHEVENALSNGGHLMIEADTGVGKSIAYLVPSILWAIKNEKKVVISTNTINLQEQLIFKDLPLLKKIIPAPFEAVLVKGRSNYLCKRRLQRVIDDESALLVPSQYRGELERLIEWVNDTKDGSISDISAEPPAQLWDEVCCEMDNCPGKNCEYFGECFFQRARQKIYKADILVVNHHLFFSDLALKQKGKSLLPKYEAVIFDEAHFMESIATEHLGFDISNFAVKYLLNKLYNSKANRGLLMYAQERDGIKRVSALSRTVDAYFSILEEKVRVGGSNILRVNKPGEIANDLSPKFMELYSELKKIKNRLKKNEDMSNELSSYIRRTAEFVEGLDAFCNQSMLGHVYWIESGEGKYKRIVLQAYPIAVNLALKSILFDTVPTVVLTGATLTVNKSFNYFKNRLGVRDIREVRLGSSFDYKKQMKIYIPKDIPSPKDIGLYRSALIEKIEKYLDYTGGKAFVLFTSYKLMQEVYEEVAPVLREKGIESFIQGDGVPRHVMLQKFREDINSVLFGTDSFWTGVDVEGEALSNVIITRLPFAVPEHPLTRARLDYIESNGGNSFGDYSLPQAIIKLRQGIGRLIRSKTDKGIIVIMDNRIITTSYGKYFLDSLPECTRIVE